MATAKLLVDDSSTIISYTGIDTHLLYRCGFTLPAGASYPLLDDPDARQQIRQSYLDLAEIGERHNLAVLLDSITWIANRDRGLSLGYSATDLQRFNRDAIKLMAEVRAQYCDAMILLSGQVGPRVDGYQSLQPMTVAEAKRYHQEQIDLYAATDVDVVNGFTLSYAEEAVGIALAAQTAELPVLISFTVETDGRLPSGMRLNEAINYVDSQTNSGPLFYMINCAHPDHFTRVLSTTTEDAKWMLRLRGLVVNASRCSHRQLQIASTLDDGDPTELALQLAALRRRFPHFKLFGGCCGTDMRHIRQLVTQLSNLNLG